MRKNCIICHLIGLLLLFTQAHPCLAQTDPSNSRSIPVSFLRSDLQTLRDRLEKVHPGIYRYRTKEQIDHVLDSCLASIKEPMQLTGFYALTSFAIAAMEDGHSNCRMPREAMNEFIKSTPVFPAMVIFIHEHAYIYCCKQAPGLAGSELLSINGVAGDVIVQKLFSYIPSDANIASRKNWELPEYFHLLYNAVYGAQNQFDITYRMPDGIHGKAKLAPATIKEIFCDNPFPAPKKWLELTYAPGNVAVFQIKTFLDDYLKQTGESFSAFLDSAFNDIRQKGVQKLLIDLRRNQGGNDGNGARLYAYLTQKPFAYYASLETVQEKFTPEGHALLNIQEPAKNNFAGKVFVLTDGRSFSASSEFAAIAKSTHRAVFLGEENGGGYYGNTSGDDLQLDLPNTHISCRIPLVKYTTAVNRLPGGVLGVLPEHALYPTITDILEHKDRMLEQSIVFIRSH